MMSNDLLVAALNQLQVDCPEVQGAVLATDEGFVLAAMGNLIGEEAAATAAHLRVVVEQNLSLVLPTQCREILVWGTSALWYIARVSRHHVVMVAAAVDCRPGTLKLVTQGMASNLADMLANLENGVETSLPAEGFGGTVPI
jgi:predicted regulator of Ras-like GTPase activity (Roadblock/LC7/MglB family)